MAHRVIWKMVHDEEPEEIDHIDGNPSNNRLDNLRAVDRITNLRNMRRSKANTSGVTGVHFRRGYWIASIHDEGRQVELGYFTNKDEAIRARNIAERDLDYHPNHGRAPC